MKSKISNNYLSKLSLKETQEAINYIEENLIASLFQHLNFIKVREPKITMRKQESNLLFDKNVRPITFDSVNDNYVYYIYNSHRIWLVNTLKILEVDNNNGILTKLNFINRDVNISNICSMEKNILAIEYRFDNKKQSFQKSQEISKIIYNILFSLKKELKKTFPKLIENFKENPIVKTLNRSKENSINNKEITYASNFGLYILENTYNNKDFFNSVNSNFNISINSYLSEINTPYKIVEIKDRVTPYELNEKKLSSNLIREEYLYLKEDILDKELKSISIQIDLDLLSLFLLEKVHILELQSGMNNKEIEKYFSSKEIKHL